MSGPLSGVRVLDLTSVVMGPYAMQVLREAGCSTEAIDALLAQGVAMTSRERAGARGDEIAGAYRLCETPDRNGRTGFYRTFIIHAGG